MTMIYLIEDVPLLRTTLAKRIQEHGSVVGFYSSEDALKYLLRNPRHAPDLVVSNEYSAGHVAGVRRSDELIPELMDTISDLKRLREISQRKIPIIFYTLASVRKDIGGIATGLFRELAPDEDIIPKVSKQPNLGFTRSLQMVEDRICHYLEGVRV